MEGPAACVTPVGESDLNLLMVYLPSLSHLLPLLAGE